MTAVLVGSDSQCTDDVATRSVLVLRRRYGLVAVRYRRHDRVLAALCAYWLDGRLAAGACPETSRLLAVRASQLTGPRVRNRLARHWDDLAARARQRRDDATADQSGLVADLLRGSRPLSARGVAIAAEFRGTPANPAYRPGGSGADIAAAVARTLTASTE